MSFFFNECQEVKEKPEESKSVKDEAEETKEAPLHKKKKAKEEEKKKAKEEKKVKEKKVKAKEASVPIHCTANGSAPIAEEEEMDQKHPMWWVVCLF